MERLLRKIKKVLRNPYFLVGIPSLLFVIVHAFLLLPGFSGDAITAENASNFGEFIGGYVGTLISIGALFIVWKTYLDTSDQNNRKSFEDNFFQFLNIFEMTVSSQQIGSLNGKNIFPKIIQDIEINAELVKEVLTRLEIAFNAKEKTILSLLILFEGPLFHQHKISHYLTTSILGNKTEEFEAGLILEIEKYITKIKKSDAPDKDDLSLTSENAPWRSRQTVLSIYFRQLFHIFEYIDETEALDQHEKYRYGRIMRSCLTTQQQAVLAINIWTGFGQSWESTGYLNKYCPIKNLPEFYLKELTDQSIKDLFPTLRFEYENMKDKSNVTNI